MSQSKSASKAWLGKQRPHSKYSQTGYIRAERSAELIAENEACFQVMMQVRAQPGLWRDLFGERNAGQTWAQIWRAHFWEQFGEQSVPSETNLLPISNNPD